MTFELFLTLIGMMLFGWAVITALLKMCHHTKVWIDVLRKKNKTAFAGDEAIKIVAMIFVLAILGVVGMIGAYKIAGLF